jgi:hypothetical protein
VDANSRIRKNPMASLDRLRQNLRIGKFCRPWGLRDRRAGKRVKHADAI